MMLMRIENEKSDPEYQWKFVYFSKLVQQPKLIYYMDQSETHFKLLFVLILMNFSHNQ